MSGGAGLMSGGMKGGDSGAEAAATRENGGRGGPGDEWDDREMLRRQLESEAEVKAGLLRHVRGLELRLAQLEEGGYAVEEAARQAKAEAERLRTVNSRMEEDRLQWVQSHGAGRGRGRGREGERQGGEMGVRPWA